MGEEGEQEDEDNKEDQEDEDDVLVEELDPIEDIVMPPNRRSQNIPESRPSLETPPSSGTLGASSSMGRRKKKKGKDPMASVLKSLLTMMAES